MQTSNSQPKKSQNNTVRPEGNTQNNAQDSKPKGTSSPIQFPSLSLPKGGGAIQGIGEKFQANPVTGTGSMSVPITVSPGRSGFAPQLALSYDSGAGNSAFGLGWNVGVPSISRKTQKGLPQYDGLPKYQDAIESDVFLLSGAEDLVPVLKEENNEWVMETPLFVGDFTIQKYRPRVEGLFAKIEKWTASNGEVHWRTTTKDNLTSVYGLTADSQIVDPANPKKVFSWLLERTFDNKGNVLLYEYKREDLEGVEPTIFEKNRNAGNATAQLHLKKVKYGNTKPYFSGHKEPIVPISPASGWLFELVFDYGEHETIADLPRYQPTQSWIARQDPFSSYRAGFEIRDYRLCRRILMFHRFSEFGDEPVLVKSTDLDFFENKIATQVKSIRHRGYLTEEGTTTTKTFPPVEFKYTEQKIDNTIYSIAASDLPNVPQGIDGKSYQWLDLEGEGLSGIFSQTESAWYFKRNLGDGAFAPKEVVKTRPSLTGAGVMDYEGNGLNDYVLQNGGLNGYFETDDSGEWQAFRSFSDIPNIDWNDPNMRRLDLDGDGIADLLITENDCFVWYSSKAKDGYDPAIRIAKALDEEQGPRIVFQEAFQTIFLANLSGGSMTDICRIRNGEICYWPNLGYGRFGAKVTMANAPHFDRPDQFDSSRLRLTDIDGAGPTDIIYLGKGEFTYWINQSGNSWSAAKTVSGFPLTTPLHSVQAMDLLGNGTSCIVWSSPLPNDAKTPLRYIQLMGKTETEGNKPYLLKEVNNNMGAVTRLKYEASTRFYLDDRKAGRPWITKLSFPVQVLTQQEVYDAISDTHFVSKYAYHHGYFDPVEREFRGFGMVEQWDTEHYDAFQETGLFEWKGKNWTKDSFIPPMHTKTWFHNGYYRQQGKITRQYESEYYGARDAQGNLTEWTLPDTVLSNDLRGGVAREAARALKGRPLRVEVYSNDAETNPLLAPHPYTVTESNYQIKVIQPKGENRHTVFYVAEKETLTFQYERNPNDPRIAHSFALELDDFGNPLRNLAVVYPRRATTIHAEQKQLYSTLTQAKFINKPDTPEFYRIGVPYEQQLFELTGLKNIPDQPFSKTDILNALDGNSSMQIPPSFEIEFEAIPDLTKVQKRLVQSAKTTFYNENLSGELNDGEIASHALPFKAKELAYTEAQLNNWFNGKIDPADLDTLMIEAGFEKENDQWWRPSGKVIFDKNHFYLPTVQKDIFGQETTLEYDAYALMPTRSFTTINGVTLETKAQFDYRTLQPRLVSDPNGKFSEAIFDEMGMVVATAVYSKTGEGDTLSGYYRTPVPELLDNRAAIFAKPLDYLQGASTYFHYDLHAWRERGTPNFALSMARTEHHSETAAPDVQMGIVYTDGFGRELLTKVQAEPGKAIYWDESTASVQESPIGSRWVGNGRTIFNNKGKPVKQYEPYFSTSWDYEGETALREYGVTPIIHYDAAGRVVRTDMPDGTFSKVEFTPWEQRSFDQNDTVLESEWYAGRTDNSRADYIVDSYEQRAAMLSKEHANTPKIEHFDTLGRIFLMQDHNGYDSTGVAQMINTHFKLDIEGNQVAVTDAKGRLITVNTFNLTGEAVYTNSMDAGNRWMLTNALGNPIYAWNERGFRTRMRYDGLQRPIETWIQKDTDPEKLVQLNIYGEMLTEQEAIAKNLLGLTWRHFDASGCITSEAHDFKGNLLKANIKPAKSYKTITDWSAVVGTITPSPNLEILIDGVANALLESDSYETEISYDALNRSKITKSPDGSNITYGYNEAGLLENTSLRHGRTGESSEPIKNIDYDAKGQRTLITYGNGVKTTYKYDPQTFRLTALHSTRNGEAVQLLEYHYDPVGNITDMRDGAQQNVFFKNSVVSPHGAYTYDALYRLLTATGREHGGQQGSFSDLSHELLQIGSPSDGTNMRNYRQSYEYDELGNILKVRHQAGSAGSWTRDYAYNENSPLEPNRNGNRLSNTTIGGTTYTYAYDVHSNMTQMPHLSTMQWDYADQLCAIDLMGGGKEYYIYDAGGQRTRKVWEKPNGIAYERFYIGDFEVYRERRLSDDTILQETESLHIMDDRNRIAMIETPMISNTSPITQHSALMRYQLSNHLGSACVELDEAGTLISYEEYHPFGSSSYHAMNDDMKAARKRYRYVGKERDESSGLDYYGARYCISWLGRWCSCDPAGFVDGWNVFIFVKNNPIYYKDQSGKNSEIVIDKENKTITITASFYYFEDSEISKGKDWKDASKQVEHSITIFEKGWDSKSGRYPLAESDEWTVNFNIKIEPLESENFTAFKSNATKKLETEKHTANFIYYDKNLKNKTGKEMPGIAKENFIILGPKWGRDGSTLQHEIAHTLGLDEAAWMFNTRDSEEFLLESTEQQKSNTSKEEIGPITSYNKNREIKNREIGKLFECTLVYSYYVFTEKNILKFNVKTGQHDQPEMIE